jgi:YidC/Oxa1 family membrane protein insertase
LQSVGCATRRLALQLHSGMRCSISRSSPAIHPCLNLLEVTVMLVVLGVAVGAAYHVVSALAQLLAPVAGSLATPVAIVGFTMAVRVLLLPLSFYAMRGQARMARVSAQAQALRERHAGQRDRQERELAALYQRQSGGMLAGCLPLLLQLPFLSVMYTLFRSATIAGRPNGLLGHNLLGAPLGSHWLSGPGPFSVQGAVFLGLFLLLAGASWLAARASRRSPTTAQPPAPAGGAVGALARFMPYVTVAIASVMPLAAGLYLLTTTAWAAVERTVLAPHARIPDAGGKAAAGDG